MKENEKEDTQLKKALSRTYHEKENVDVGEAWEAKTMRSIRQIGPHNARADYMMLLGQFVWRLVPATSLLIVVLSAAIFQFGYMSEYELASLFFDNPMEFNLIESLFV